MSIRSLFLSLFALSLVMVFGFILLSVYVLWQQLGLLLPTEITIGYYIIPTYHFILVNAIASFVFISLVFGFLFLFLDRSIVRPIRAIAVTLDSFAEHGAVTPLPAYTRTNKETKALVDAFTKFTDSVEEVHKRDMEISRVKSDFISTAAHQLRTPLTGIRWALEALEKEPLQEDQKALVSSAVDKAHDLVAIVGTLLDISSIESGKYKYTFQPTDMDAVLSSVAKDFVLLAQKNNVTLFYEKTAAPLPLVRADRDRIKWVLNNLVENAIRYTPADGSVRLSTELTAERLYIKVRDTGIGIPEQDRNNIFERFFRAGNAISKENQGNGLGLYIARQIAVDHGGDLSFSGNDQGTGTTFTLALPITGTKAVS
jgi:signal transduction histidine kinase